MYTLGELAGIRSALVVNTPQPVQRGEHMLSDASNICNRLPYFALNAATPFCSVSALSIFSPSYTPSLLPSLPEDMMDF